MIRPALLCIALLALMLRPALTLAPLGEWVVDVPAFEARLQTMLGQAFADIPEAELDEMRARGMDPKAMMHEHLKAMGEISLELRPDGTAIGRDAAEEGEPGMDAGSWEDRGDHILVRFPDEDSHLLGRLEGDRLMLTVDPSSLPEDERGLMHEFVIPMVRR